MSRIARRRMFANWLVPSTEERVPSIACQCAIQASSAAIRSGRPVRSMLRSPFSVIFSQSSMPSLITGPFQGSGNSVHSLQIGSSSLLDRLINTSHQVIMNGPSYRPIKRPRNTADKAH
ncbi:hypothetical protein [Streptomyces sp. AK08-02]|uniref:hypothetical protein n=1 Tax=Streptomyces sp. AK08-02 TaxID=3028654 RepID=UPI0029C06998|nr:hypothetical protein [Streptomyces sp. AK08-02]